ncbi:CRISPR system Cascade subunit CasC, partial [Candidatus Hakubella thermalkaliphila]
GDRTKKLQELIGNALAAKDGQGDFIWEARSKINDEFLSEGVRVFTDAYYAKADKKKPEKTSVLIFISPSEVEVCVQAIKELWDEPKEVTKKDAETSKTREGIASIVKKRKEYDKKVKIKVEGGAGAQSGSDETQDQGDDKSEDSTKDDKRPKLKVDDEIKDRIKRAQITDDIALFGRMLAEQPGRNTDGSCQVAHPISTHKVDMEFDFYTAVDDLNPKEEPGAGMMGVVRFNSACYYRYALVDRDQLARNLASKTERTNGAWIQALETNDYEESDKVIEAFLEAMVYAIPTGKQNSFAAQNLPSFGLFVRRKDGVPISLANAFCKPVRSTKDADDLVGLSV